MPTLNTLRQFISHNLDRLYTALEMRNSMEKALMKLHTTQGHIRKVSNDMNLRQYGHFAQWSLLLTYWRDLHVANGENLIALQWTNNPYPITVKRESHSLYISYDAAASHDRRVKNEYNSHMIKSTPDQLTKHAAHASEQQTRFTNGWSLLLSQPVSTCVPRKLSN